MPLQPDYRGETAFPWLTAFPQADEATRERLRAWCNVSEDLLSRGAAGVTFTEHLRGVQLLAQLVAACQRDHATLRSRVAVLFAHDGVQSDCLYFELAHQVLFLTERLVTLVQTSELGDPTTTPPCTLSADVRRERARWARLVRGLCTHTLEVCEREWVSRAPDTNVPWDELRHLSTVVRAYGLYNAALLQLGNLLATVDRDAAAATALGQSAALLRQAHLALGSLPEGFAPVGGVLPFVNGAHAPALEASRETLAILRTAKPDQPPAEPRRAQAAWTERVRPLWWRVVAEHRAATGRHAPAVALGRVLVACWREPVPALDAWERRQTRVGGSGAVPRTVEALDAVVNEEARYEELLQRGDLTWLEGPDTPWCLQR